MRRKQRGVVPAQPELAALQRALADIEVLTEPAARQLHAIVRPRCLEEIQLLANHGRYSRSQSQQDQGAALAFREECKLRASDLSRRIDDNDLIRAGKLVALLDWDAILRDAAEVVRRTEDPAASVAKMLARAERAWFEAGSIEMKAAMRRLMDANREPAARGPWKPTLPLVVAPDDLRQYETLEDYVAYAGASCDEARRLRRRVEGSRGVVPASYDVDDEAIGDEWRRRFGDYSSDSARTHASVVLDRLCAEVYARACAPAGDAPMALGRDVREIAAVGLDCYARRAVEIAIETATNCRDHRDEFARTCLVPRLFGYATDDGKANVPANLVAAAIALGNESQDEVVRFKCAAVVSMARWLRSESPFRARAKGTGVVATRPGGLDAHEYVCDYIGEVYPAARWLEKLAAATIARREALGREKADAVPPPDAFHNIALERPASDPAGYALCFVDAGGGRANFASSLSHSCDGNVASSVFVKDDGRLSVALHTTKPVAEGEELAFDYSASTSNESEWRSAICLCGAKECRGSYVELVQAPELQRCLARGHGPLDSLALLLRASLADHDQQCQTRSMLARHGLADAFFDRTPNDDSVGGAAPWLETYVASLLGFVEFERGQLPFALLRDAVENDGAYHTKQALRARAAARARLVLEQRIQSLACAVSLAVAVARLRKRMPPPPLYVLGPADVAPLRAVLQRLKALADRFFNGRLSGVASSLALLDPDDCDTRAKCRAQLLSLRSRLLEIPDDRVAGCDPDDKKKKKRKVEHGSSSGAIAACADAIMLIVHTNTIARAELEARQPVMSAPVAVRAHEISATDDSNVVARPSRHYGPLAEVEALLCWHDLDALAEPQLGDGSLARDRLAGCAVLPDPAAVLSRLLEPNDVLYDRTELVKILEDPSARARPWPRGLRDAFFGKPGVDFFGSPMLDALLGDFTGIDIVIAGLKATAPKKVERGAEDVAVDAEAALANALPDRPPSQWVACDACGKWRVIPWTADFDETAPFACADQQAWGVPPDEANCDVPEPPWGEDDVVVKRAPLDVDTAVVGSKIDALCVKTNVWFAAKIVAENSSPVKVAKKKRGRPSKSSMPPPPPPEHSPSPSGVDELDVRRLKVHYANWGAKYDEWLEMPRDASRLAPHRTFSAANATARRRAKGQPPPKKKR